MENIGGAEIREISLDVPACPLDELFFRKAIAWFYVLLNETGPFLRFSAKLLRSDPQASEKFGKFKFLVECARTIHAHNLTQGSQSDEKKKRQYDIWLIENGGDPVDWVMCCQSLLAEAGGVLAEIQSRYARLCEVEFDRVEMWREYASDKRTHWDAHEFDPIIERATNDLKIEQIDCSLFRKEGNRLERWRKCVAMFDSREAAVKAIERAIFAELSGIFGPPET